MDVHDKRQNARLLVAIAAGVCLGPGISVSARAEERTQRPGLRLHTDKLVGILRGYSVVTGHLDKYGNFVEAPRQRPDSPGGTGPDYVIINRPLAKAEEVYEFRSSMLVKGILDSRGNFIPTPGSVVIRLSEYEPSHDAPRIYNLPGVLERRVEEDARPRDVDGKRPEEPAMGIPRTATDLSQERTKERIPDVSAAGRSPDVPQRDGGPNTKPEPQSARVPFEKGTEARAIQRSPKVPPTPATEPQMPSSSEGGKWAYLVVGIAAGLAVGAAGAWLLLRRRSGG